MCKQSEFIEVVKNDSEWQPMGKKYLYLANIIAVAKSKKKTLNKNLHILFIS